MRTTTTLFVLLAGAILMAAQETAKINKVPAQATVADSGKGMFGAYCASCHGIDGKGSGPAAPALKAQPADLTRLARKNGGKYPSLVVVNAIKNGGNAHGSKNMPVWGPVLLSVSPDGSPEVQLRISNLTAYIETLQVK